MQFNCSLGSDQTKPFKFTQFLKSTTTYTCRIEKIGAKVEE